MLYDHGRSLPASNRPVQIAEQSSSPVELSYTNTFPVVGNHRFLGITNSGTGTRYRENKQQFISVKFHLVFLFTRACNQKQFSKSFVSSMNTSPIDKSILLNLESERWRKEGWIGGRNGQNQKVTMDDDRWTIRKSIFNSKVLSSIYLTFSNCVCSLFLVHREDMVTTILQLACVSGQFKLLCLQLRFREEVNEERMLL